MNDEIKTSLRQAAGIVSDKMTQAYQETEQMSLNVTLNGEVAKRMAALCAMMETAYAIKPETMCEYVISIGLQNLRQNQENESE